MTKELGKPIFLKNTCSAKEQLIALKALDLEDKLNTEGQKLLRDNIRNSELGIEGEDNIAFQLKNSYMPMYILRDVYLEDDETKTHGQIDFLVFTRKLCFVVESKYVTGKVSIDRKARFIRIEKSALKGCESPVAQNQRHIDLIRQIRKGNESFKEIYSSVIVFSNYEMVLDDTEAPDEVGKIVIRVDELIRYIKDLYEKNEEWELSDEQLKDWAESFQHLHRNRKEDYSGIYRKYFLETESGDAVSETIAPDAPVKEPETYELYKALKEYREKRIKTANQENKKLVVYAPEAINELMNVMPATMDELSSVKWFPGNGVVFKECGEDVLAIISQYREGEK